jgi:hypothetical protein
MSMKSMKKEISEMVADAILATMPREVFPSMVMHMVSVIYALRDSELKMEHLPETPADLILTVATIVAGKSADAEKKAAEKPEPAEQSEDEVPAELDEVLEMMIDLLTKHNIKKAVIIKEKPAS